MATLFQDSIRMLLWRGFSVFGGIINASILAKVLGPEMRGDLAIFILNMTLVVIVIQFGIPQALIYVIGREEHSRAEIFSTARVFALITSFVGFCGVFLGVQIFYPTDTGILISLSVAGFASLQATYIRHFLLGIRKVNSYGKSIFYENIGLLIFLVGFASFGLLDVTSALIAYACSYLIGWICSDYCLHLHIKNSGGIKYFKKEVVAVCLKKGVHILLAGIGGFVMTRICFYFIEIFSGSKAVGLYAAAIAIPNMILGIPQQIGTALYAHLSRRADDQHAVSMIAGMCNIVILASIILFLFVLPFRSELVILFFGKEFLETENTLAVLMIWAFVSGVSGIILNAYAARGKHRFGTYLTIITLTLLVPLGPTAIFNYGIFGMSIIQLGCSVIGLGFLLVNFKAEFGLSSIRLILPSKKNIRSYLDLS